MRNPATIIDECNCGHLLACGAYDGWWCPIHKGVRPEKYAVEAAKELHAKYLDSANKLYALELQIRGEQP